AGLVEGDVADAAEQLIAPGGQVVQDHIGAARAGGCGIRAAAATAALRAPALVTAAAARAAAAVACGGRLALQGEIGRVGREDEALHVLPRLHRAGGKVAQFDARRLFRRGTAPAFALRRRGRVARCRRLRR